MTLPQNVKDAVAQLDNAMMFHADDLSYASWTAIRAHLLSQDAEIERLESAWHVETLNEKDRLIALQEAENDHVKSRLAAANALLSRCFVQIGELTKGLDPHDPIYVELQQLGLDWMQHSEADTDHLSENADVQP